jgi:hypothetical protein
MKGKLVLELVVYQVGETRLWSKSTVEPANLDSDHSFPITALEFGHTNHTDTGDMRENETTPLKIR